MATSRFFAVIVAGGSGSRMQSELPKQFIILNGLPIIMHTILKFSKHDLKPNIIIVLAKDHVDIWENLKVQYNFNIPHTLIYGGEERFYSVKNTLHLFKNDSVIAIHDAVRPLLTNRLISDCFNGALKLGNSISAIDSKDSVRICNENSSKSINRKFVKLIQTPQAFQYTQLKKSYEVGYHERFTDDASVVENAGYKINLTEGENYNIKITYPEDLLIASSILKM